MNRFLLRAFNQRLVDQLAPHMLPVRDTLTVQRQRVGHLTFYVVSSPDGKVRSALYAFKAKPGFAVGRLSRAVFSDPPPSGVVLTSVEERALQRLGWFPEPPHDRAPNLIVVNEWALRSAVSAVLRGVST